MKPFVGIVFSWIFSLYNFDGFSQTWQRNTGISGFVSSVVELPDGNLLATNYDNYYSGVGFTTLLLMNPVGEIVQRQVFKVDNDSLYYVFLQQTKEGKTMFLAGHTKLNEPFQSLGWIEDNLNITVKTVLADSIMGSTFISGNLPEFDTGFRTVAIGRANGRLNRLKGLVFDKELQLIEASPVYNLEDDFAPDMDYFWTKGAPGTNSVYLSVIRENTSSKAVKIEMTDSMSFALTYRNTEYWVNGCVVDVSDKGGLVHLQSGYFDYNSNYSFCGYTEDSQKIVFIDNAGNQTDSVIANKLKNSDGYDALPLFMDIKHQLIMAGEARFYGSGSQPYYTKVLLTKVDTLLNVIYSKSVKLPFDIWFYGNAVTSDGGFILTGEVGNATNSSYEGIVVKFDENGSVSWIQSLEGEPAVLQAFPSPATSYFTLDLPVSLSNASLCVFNSQGQKIYEGSTGSGNNKIDCSTWPAGNYFVLCYGANGVSTAKVVKD